MSTEPRKFVKSFVQLPTLGGGMMTVPVWQSFEPARLAKPKKDRKGNFIK